MLNIQGRGCPVFFANGMYMQRDPELFYVGFLTPRLKAIAADPQWAKRIINDSLGAPAISRSGNGAGCDRNDQGQKSVAKRLSARSPGFHTGYDVQYGQLFHPFRMIKREAISDPATTIMASNGKLWKILIIP